MAQNERYKTLIDDCISKMAEDEKDLFKQIAEYAVELGYTPKTIKTARGVSDALTFTKSKVKRTLLKIRPNKNGNSQLVLSFFASSDYSDVFKQGIKLVIDEFNGRYTGCYGCGKCEKGKLQGYTFIYPDGKKVFRCGGALIELPPISLDNIAEIKQLMIKQDECFLEMAKKTV